MTASPVLQAPIVINKSRNLAWSRQKESHGDGPPVLCAIAGKVGRPRLQRSGDWNHWMSILMGMLGLPGAAADVLTLTGTPR